MKQKFKVGDKVKIKNDNSHFDKGEIVKIIEYDESDNAYGCEFLDGHNWWWVEEADLQVITHTLTIKKLTRTRAGKEYHTTQFIVKGKIVGHQFNTKQSRDKSLTMFIKYIQDGDFKIVKG